jgi:hypothetical protein
MKKLAYVLAGLLIALVPAATALSEESPNVQMMFDSPSGPQCSVYNYNLDPPTAQVYPECLP